MSRQVHQSSPPILGVSAEFMDFRTDIRRLLTALGDTLPIVALLPPTQDSNHRLLPREIEARVLSPEPRSLRNRLVLFGGKYLAKPPKSRRNYYVSLLFRVYKTPRGWPRVKAKLDAIVRMMAPRVLSFERTMQLLEPGHRAEVDALDCMLFLTEIENLGLAAEWLRTGKPTLIYVYSWDHPPKYVRFPKDAHYLGWNSDVLGDLVNLHGIDPSRCHVVGSTQFAYIEQYRRSEWPTRERPYPFPYLLFAASTGTLHLAVKEVECVRRLSAILADLGSPLRIVFRPYPHLRDWGAYEDLRGLNNVTFDDQYRDTGLALSEDSVMEKFWKIDNAAAVLHFGTTFGLEACFFDTPSCIIDAFPQERGEIVGIWDFVHQYQNEKYLLLDGYPNVVRKWEDLRSIVESLDRGAKGTLIRYNLAVSERFELSSFDSIAARIREIVIGGKVRQGVRHVS